MAVEWVGSVEAAKRLGMSVQGLGMWAKRPGAPTRQGKKGLEYGWPAFPRWRDGEIERRAKEEARPKTLDEARQRREAAEAQIAELTLAERQGKLCTLDAVIEAQAAIAMRIRSQLLALPSKLGPQCLGLRTISEAVAVLDVGVNDVMAELRGNDDDRD